MSIGIGLQFVRLTKYYELWKGYFFISDSNDNLSNAKVEKINLYFRRDLNHSKWTCNNESISPHDDTLENHRMNYLVQHLTFVKI